MQQELTGDWPRASQGLDVMEMDPLEQGHDIYIKCETRQAQPPQHPNCVMVLLYSVVNITT